MNRSKFWTQSKHNLYLFLHWQFKKAFITKNKNLVKIHEICPQGFVTDVSAFITHHPEDFSCLPSIASTLSVLAFGRTLNWVIINIGGQRLVQYLNFNFWSYFSSNKFGLFGLAVVYFFNAHIYVSNIQQPTIYNAFWNIYIYIALHFEAFRIVGVFQVLF